jgi:hypothetical protein
MREIIGGRWAVVGALHSMISGGFVVLYQCGSYAAGVGRRQFVR